MSAQKHYYLPKCLWMSKLSELIPQPCQWSCKAAITILAFSPSHSKDPHNWRSSLVWGMVQVHISSLRMGHVHVLRVKLMNLNSRHSLTGSQWQWRSSCTGAIWSRLWEWLISLSTE
jgi:hypothetical protein